MSDDTSAPDPPRDTTRTTPVGAHRARPRPAPLAAPGPSSLAAAPESDALDPQPPKPDEPGAAARPGILRRWAESGAAGSRRAGLIALVAGALALAVVVALVVFLINRDGGDGTPARAADDLVAQVTDEARAQGFVAGATSDIAAVTSYSYQTLASDIANGEAVSTGGYRARYRAALTGSLGATTMRLHRTQSFDLAVAGIGQISSNGRQAHVLLFGTQNVQDDTTDGRTDQSLITLDATIVNDDNAYLISDLEVGTDAGLPPGTTGLTNAAEAARQEIANLLTTRRAHLAADQQAALALAVDPLHAQLTSQVAEVGKAVTSGNYDLTGVVTAVAVQSADGNTVTMLVAATGTKTTSAGASSLATDGRYVVTVVRVQNRWLVSTVSPIAVS